MFCRDDFDEFIQLLLEFEFLVTVELLEIVQLLTDDFKLRPKTSSKLVGYVLDAVLVHESENVKVESILE